MQRRTVALVPQKLDNTPPRPPQEHSQRQQQQQQQQQEHKQKRGQRVWSWGAGGNGQLASGTLEDSASPLDVGLHLHTAYGCCCCGLGDGFGSSSCSSGKYYSDGCEDVIRDVACGGSHALAVSEAGTVLAWGWAHKGALGLPDLQPAVRMAQSHPPPASPPSLRTAAAAATATATATATAPAAAAAPPEAGMGGPGGSGGRSGIAVQVQVRRNAQQEAVVPLPRCIPFPPVFATAARGVAGIGCRGKHGPFDASSSADTCDPTRSGRLGEGEGGEDEGRKVGWDGGSHRPTLDAGIGGSIHIDKVAAGWANSAFLSDVGLLWMCGSNELGQLGLGPHVPFASTPQLVLSPVPEQQQQLQGQPVQQPLLCADVACGKYHTVVLAMNQLPHEGGQLQRQRQQRLQQPLAAARLRECDGAVVMGFGLAKHGQLGPKWVPPRPKGSGGKNTPQEGGEGSRERGKGGEGSRERGKGEGGAREGVDSGVEGRDLGGQRGRQGVGKGGARRAGMCRVDCGQEKAVEGGVGAVRWQATVVDPDNEWLCGARTAPRRGPLATRLPAGAAGAGVQVVEGSVGQANVGSGCRALWQGCEGEQERWGGGGRVLVRSVAAGGDQSAAVLDDGSLIVWGRVWMPPPTPPALHADSHRRSSTDHHRRHVQLHAGARLVHSNQSGTPSGSTPTTTPASSCRTMQRESASNASRHPQPSPRACVAVPNVRCCCCCSCATCGNSSCCDTAVGRSGYACGHGHGHRQNAVAGSTALPDCGLIGIDCSSRHNSCDTNSSSCNSNGSSGSKNRSGSSGAARASNSKGSCSGNGLLHRLQVSHVSLGWRHGLLLTTHGQVYAWGSNAFGQCGPSVVCDGCCQHQHHCHHRDSCRCSEHVARPALESASPTVLDASERSSQSASATVPTCSCCCCSCFCGKVQGSSRMDAAPAQLVKSSSRQVQVEMGMGLAVEMLPAVHVPLPTSPASASSSPSPTSCASGQAPALAAPAGAGAAPGITVRAVCVAAGAEHSAAVLDDGRVVTWGWGEHGQLGHGDTDDTATPKFVSLPCLKLVDTACRSPTVHHHLFGTGACGPTQPMTHQVPLEMACCEMVPREVDCGETARDGGNENTLHRVLACGAGFSFVWDSPRLPRRPST